MSICDDEAEREENAERGEDRAQDGADEQQLDERVAPFAPETPEDP